MKISSLTEDEFLRKVVNGYSPSLVVSFLKTRINYDREMISKIKNLNVNLDQSRRDLFDLITKFYDILSEQLIALKDSDYFDINGTNKIQYFVEQFILQNQMYPIGFGSYQVVKLSMTPDELLSLVTIESTDKLIKKTRILITSYINDIETKESNPGNNIIQKLSLNLTKIKLGSLRNFDYSSDESTIRLEIANNLKKLKIITDFFYSQYEQLSHEMISINYDH